MSVKTRIMPDVALSIDPAVDAFISITIGNTQIGGSIVRFKGETEPIDKGRIRNVLIGNGNTLTGKTLEVITNVLDSNKATNKISIAHKFPGCTPAAFLYTDEVDANKDIFSLITTYVFQ